MNHKTRALFCFESQTEQISKKLRRSLTSPLDLNKMEKTNDIQTDILFTSVIEEKMKSETLVEKAMSETMQICNPFSA